MKFRPIPPMEHKPAAFVTAATANSVTVREFDGPPRTFRGEQQVIEGLFCYGEYALYSLIPLVDLCRCYPHLWALYAFNRNATRAEIGNLRVYSLVGFGLDPGQLRPFFDALDAAGVQYGSRSAMLKNSLRRTLTEEIAFRDDHAKVGRSALRSGRRETIPGLFNAAVNVDMPAAYPHAMMAPIPTRLREAEPGWYDAGIGRAVITVREPARQQWLPFDRRELTGEQRAELSLYGSAMIRGYWTFDELRVFQQAGAKVQIEQAWEGADVADVFGVWARWALELRRLPGQSGRLAKAWTNRLWSIFAVAPGSKYTRTTFDMFGTPTSTTIPFGSPESAAFVSAIVASRVRVRLYREGLGAGAIVCDTDGVVVPFTTAAFLEARGWRRKVEMAQIEVISQHAYRYKCMRGVREHLPIDGCIDCMGSRWHYVVLGELPGSAEAEEWFMRERRRFLAMADEMQEGNHGVTARQVHFPSTRY